MNRKARIIVWLFGLCSLLGLMAPLRANAQTQNFTIQSFEADYYISASNNKTSQLRVEETILAQFPEYDQNHGILRAVPKSYQGHTVSLNVEKVTNERGENYPFSTSTQKGNLVLKIGEQNKYVHGLTTYKVRYSLRNVINFQQGGDEFYWDVNGDEWQQTVQAATARFHVPTGLGERFQAKQRCLSGSYGSQSSNCTISRTSNQQGEQLVTVQATNLQPHQTLTFVTSFDKGTFTQGPEISQERRWRTIKQILSAGAIIIPPLAIGIIMHRRWRAYGDDPSGRGVIIPQYQPPKELNVLSSGFILNESINSHTMSALIIELAVKRYITIYETEQKQFLRNKKSYELGLEADPKALSGAQLDLVYALFGIAAGKGARVRLSDLKNKLYKEVTSTDNKLAEELSNQGYFRTNPKKVGAKYFIAGLGLTIVGIALTGAFSRIIWPVGIGVLLSGIVAFIFSRIMPARSEKGVTTKEYLLGLRDYMKLAEADRIKFLQSLKGAERLQADPQDKLAKIKLFESLLPYAVLFGIEKSWAKQFENLYTQPPQWYQGNFATFQMSNLTSSIGGMTQASSVAFSAPSSSSGSGFGGGGFAGGGGGGGGGGGW